MPPWSDIGCAEALRLIGRFVVRAVTDAGEVLAGRLMELMRAADIPNGLTGVGSGAVDIGSLVSGAGPQRRLMDNAPCAIDDTTLATLYENALSYW